MAALIVPTVAVIGIAYTVYNFTTRISPTIPYAGEETLSARLQVPVEYGKDPVEFLRRTRKKLGDVFCVDLFAMKVVFILGSEGNREILRAAEDKISFWEEIKWLMGPVVGESELQTTQLVEDVTDSAIRLQWLLSPVGSMQVCG